MTLTCYADDNNVTPGPAPGPHRRVHGAASQRHHRGRDPPGRHRRRQHRQDPPGHGRHDRHLLVQLRLAAPGAQPDRDARRPVRRAVHRQHRRVVPADRLSNGEASSACRSRTAMGGGILYNKQIYADLGLSVPKTWAEFAANNEAIKAAGIAAGRAPRSATPGPRSCSCSPTTTTSRQADPGLRRGLHRQQGQVRRRRPRRWPASSTCRRPSRRTGSRRTSAPTTFDDGLNCSPRARCAHYPMLTFALGDHRRPTTPTRSNDIGFFGQPGDDAATNGATIWMPAGDLHPRTTSRARRRGQGSSWPSSLRSTAARP